MELAKTYNILEVRGDAYERGFSYGHHHRELLKRLLKSHFDFYVQKGFTREQVLSEASQFAKSIRNYSDMVSDEQRGTAEGAGVSLEEIVTLGAFIEILDIKVSRSARESRHCTAFAARGEATVDHLTYVGQNNDEPLEPWLGGECTTLTRYVQQDAPTALIYTYCGVPAMMGINSSGLSVCLNGLVGGEIERGVPVMTVVREVLNQRSLEDAIEVIRKAPLSYNLNFVVGTPDGIADIEAYPGGAYVHFSNELIWHANNWIYSDLKRDVHDEYSITNSRTRTERMKYLLESNNGKLGLDTLKHILSDHESSPNALCWHAEQPNPRNVRVKTFDSMIYIPEKKEAWIARGNPCQTPFEKYTP